MQKKADELKTELKATVIRLYVSVDNLSDVNLYKYCGLSEGGQTFFYGKIIWDKGLY